MGDDKCDYKSCDDVLVSCADVPCVDHAYYIACHQAFNCAELCENKKKSIFLLEICLEDRNDS